jgi:hypothetical protein
MKTHALAVFVLAGACAQPSQHVQQLTVTARQLGPEVIVAQDVSTALPLESARQALPPVLAHNPSEIVFGLTEFPSPALTLPALCATTLPSVVPIMPTMDSVDVVLAQAQTVQRALEAAAVGGQRNATAAVSGATFVSTERDHFVLLITSGDDTCGASLSDAVKAQRLAGVRTVVVSTGPALDDVATLGGFQATCPFGTDAECGAGNACDTSSLVCTHATFLAPDAAAMSATMQRIFATLSPDSVCTMILDSAVQSGTTVEVLINGNTVPEGDHTWTVEGGQRIAFHDAVCAELSRSTPHAPAKIQVVTTDYK